MKTKLTDKGHPVRTRVDLTHEDIAQMEARIKELGISRSEYFRALVYDEIRHPIQAADLAS